MKNIRTWGIALLATFCPALAVTALAQESSETFTVDLSAAENAVDEIGEKISGFFTGKLLTNILIVLGAALVIWAVFLGVKKLLGGAKKVGN